MSTPENQNSAFKDRVREDWTRGALAWRKWHGPFVELTESATGQIVAAAQAAQEMHILDVASGSGEPALTLADAVGPRGRVTATDLVPEMLSIAEEHARARGLTNIEFRQADAEALPFADASFDAVTCRFGIMFCPNAEVALREIRRVLKPGGRAAFLVWGAFEKNPYFTTTAGVFMQHVKLPPPPPGTPTPFTFAEPGSLSTAMQAAGFKGIVEEAVTIPWVFPGPAQKCWDFIHEVTGPVFHRFFAALPPDRHAQVLAEVLAAIGRYQEGRRVHFSADVIVVTGMR